MLFMTIFRWDPGRTDEVMRKRETEFVPEGLEILNEWTELGANTVFRLIEVKEPAALLENSYVWGDLGYIEMHPVMESKEALKYLG
jgi:hypothetical protein